MKQFKLKAGQVVKLNGIPITLTEDAAFEAHEDNYKLFCSQLLSDNPVQAASPVSLATKSESLLSVNDIK